MTTDYWAGWSNTVNTWRYNGLYVFRACVYAQYVAQPNGTYSLNSDVAAALNGYCSLYPGANAICHGLWASEPQPCSACARNTSPTWPVYNAFNQTYCYGYYSISVVLWQFAEHGISNQQSGCVYYCGYPDYAGGQNMDLDSDNSGGAVAQSYMLVIP